MQSYFIYPISYYIIYYFIHYIILSLCTVRCFITGLPLPSYFSCEAVF